MPCLMPILHRNGAASDVVVTMLPEPKHVREALLGAAGAAAGMRPGGTVIDMSTIDPLSSQAIAAELKAHGIDMVDSPVGKTSEHAATGTLTLMVGGEPAVIEAIYRSMMEVCISFEHREFARLRQIGEAT